MSKHVKSLLMACVQGRQIVQLGHIQKEPLADPEQVLQRLNKLNAATFYDMPRSTVIKTLQRLSPAFGDVDSVRFGRLLANQLQTHLAVLISCAITSPVPASVPFHRKQSPNESQHPFGHATPRRYLRSTYRQ
eukprot:6200423-Pleurochrysis_carterae.AAC.1